MAEWTKERRTDVLYVKVTPTLKEQAQKRAEQEGRSLSNYIEWLVLKDIEWLNAKHK